MTLRAIPIDQFFAEVEETRERRYGPADPRHGVLAKKIREEDERRKAMADTTCRIEGCKHPKYKSNALCYEHFYARQKERKKPLTAPPKAKAPTPPVKPVEPTTATNPPVVVEMGTLETEVVLEDAGLASSYTAILAELAGIMERKHRDYGPDNISALGIKGVFVRTWDKINRLKTLVWEDREASVAEETIDDTLLDIANYAIIALLLRREQWGKPWDQEAA